MCGEMASLSLVRRLSCGSALVAVLASADASAAPAAPATALDRATQAFAAERWEPAAIALEEVTRTGAPWEREVAEWELGVALYRMNLRAAAFARFSVIADRPNHARFRETLGWLVRLAQELPEPADVAERISKWDAAEVDRAAGGDRAVLAQLAWLAGRDHYFAGRYELALRSFAAVPAGTAPSAKSQLFCAAANVQLRRSAPALACLQSAGSDPALRDLANLAIARTLYSDSFRLGQGGGPTIDRAKLDAAIAAWSSVGRASPLWLDALADQAWAYFMERDDARALGNLHTLDAPYFAESYFPDAWLLRSLVYATNCQWESATTTALSFQRRWLPVEAELARLVARLGGSGGDALALATVEALDTGAAVPELAPIARAPLLHVARDRGLAREAAWVRFIEAERARVEESPALRPTVLRTSLEDTLDLARALAVADLARHLRREVGSEHDALERDLRESADLVVALPTLMRTGTAPGAGRPAGTATITVDHEHVKWPFDGEFWRDELGSYREAVEPRCGPR